MTIFWIKCHFVLYLLLFFYLFLSLWIWNLPIFFLFFLYLFFYLFLSLWNRNWKPTTHLWRPILCRSIVYKLINPILPVLPVLPSCRRTSTSTPVKIWLSSTDTIESEIWDHIVSSFLSPIYFLSLWIWPYRIFFSFSIFLSLWNRNWIPPMCEDQCCVERMWLAQFCLFCRPAVEHRTSTSTPLKSWVS